MSGAKVGSFIGAVGGLVFIVSNAGVLPGAWSLVVRLVGIGTSAVVVVALVLRADVIGSGAVPTRPQLRGYGFTVLAEVIAILVGSRVLVGVFDLAEATLPWGGDRCRCPLHRVRPDLQGVDLRGARRSDDHVRARRSGDGGRRCREAADRCRRRSRAGRDHARGRRVDHLAIGERREVPILIRHDGQRLDRRTAHRWVKAIGNRAGLGHVHPRMLRGAFIMAALDAGVPLRDVQLAARHADPRTTTIYDRRRENFDRHAAYVLVAFVAGA